MHLYNGVLFGRKMNEVLTHAMTYVKLEHIMLREAHHKKMPPTYDMIPPV